MLIKSLKQLQPFLIPFREALFVIFLSIPFLAFLQGVQPYLLKITIDKLLKHETERILILPILLGLSILILFILKIWQNYLVQSVGQKIVTNIRQKLFEHLQSLSIDFFEENQVGKLLTRLTSDIEAISETFSSGLVGGTNDLLCLIGILLFMFFIDWKLALSQVILFPLLFLLTKIFEKNYQKASLEARKQLGQLNSLFQESLLGIKIIKIFSQAKSLENEFAEVNIKYVKANDKYIAADALFSAVIELVSILAIILIILSIILLKNNLNINPGKLIAFIGYTQFLFGPIRSLSEKFSVFQAGFTSLQRINELLIVQNKLNILNNNKNFVFPTNEININFENVFFKYKPEQDYILENINFKLLSGQSLGIVGQTGSGKSTLIKLLCRFYDPISGQIFLNNTNLKNLDSFIIRQNILMIPQRSFLFSGSVKDNLLLNKTNLSEQKLLKICEETGLSELMKNWKNGLNTELREGGIDLSSGQKQLISLTRALIQDFKILILDEATASLDFYSEQIITKAIQKIIHSGKTVIFIAHRLNLVRECDQILVLQNGKIREKGSHDELIKQNQYYSQLISLNDLI